MERKIYSPWAFTENESEKCKINHQIYTVDLKAKAKVFWGNKKPTEEDLKNFMCYEGAGSGYGHTKYRILSNPHKLTHLEQALICDSGNLCFGYRIENGLIVIYTD
jgi:hypothetical protein